MRTLMEKVAAMPGSTEIFTRPSHGYRVSCTIFTVRFPIGTSAVPPISHRDIGGSAGVEVHVKSVAAQRVHVARHRGHEARNVAGTAGHAEPRAASVPAVRFERILIEERLPIQRHAANETVVERALHHVDVFGVTVQQEEPLVPEVIADRGAGFVVSGQIWQLVVPAEGFALAGWAA